jgi:hypothetical protein
MNADESHWMKINIIEYMDEYGCVNDRNLDRDEYG